MFLMVVAADEGVMPQTREHLTVLDALGVRTGVVALSRRDLADPGVRRTAAAEARRLIDAPLVEVSAVTGEGLDELRDELAAAADRAEAARPPAQWEEPAVLHIDRVFTLRGIGKVVTGTLWSGTLQTQQRIEVLPTRVELRIRSIQVHDRPVEVAESGQRVALNLTGPDRDRVSRGDVVCSAGAPLEPSYRLDVSLRSDLGLREGDRRVVVHHGTRRATARVVALDESGLAQLRLESPLIARAGDRFVLRRVAPAGTLGGGSVVDPNPARHGPGPPAGRIRRIAEAGPEELLALALEESAASADRRGIPADPVQWSTHPLLGPVRRRYPPERWRAAVEEMLGSGRAEERAGLLVSSAAAEEEKPEARPPVPLDERALRALELIREDGAAPRSPAALAQVLGGERDEAEAALEALAEAGRATRVKPGVYYETATLERLRSELLAAAVAGGGEITLGEARDLLGTSRKYAQALLEHLDAEHLTVRQGDRHVLRRAGREQVGTATAGA
jgi:selenocysteine-specific elongation factor